MINFDKGISTSLGIFVIVINATIWGGGMVAYQFWLAPIKEMPVFQISLSDIRDFKENMEDWIEYEDSENNFKVKYPGTFGGNVWRAQFWPPQVVVLDSKLDIIDKGCVYAEMGRDYTKEKIIIKNREFLLFKSSDAGAGSLYNGYCYVFENNEKYYAINFLIWSHAGCGEEQCGAYCQTQFETECQNLDRIRDIQQPMEKIVSTLKIIDRESE